MRLDRQRLRAGNPCRLQVIARCAVLDNEIALLQFAQTFQCIQHCIKLVGNCQPRLMGG